MRGMDVIAVLVVMVLCAGCSALNLADILHSRQYQISQSKRGNNGNPCPSPEKPFPCKNSDTCIPMGYVCDDNWDCEDGYDENKEVCTAAHRPPVEDIIAFLNSEKSWIMKYIFGKKSIPKIAHGLAVSQSVEDFRRRVGLSGKSVKNLKKALYAVKENREEDMEQLGMPSSAWSEVVFFFNKLIKSGFAG